MSATDITQQILDALNRLGGGFPSRKDFCLGDFLNALSGGEARFDPGIRTVYVDPDNGDDSNDGLTPSTPVQDLQLAVNQLKPWSVGMQYWPLDDDRFIQVLGSGKFEASVVIPPHGGLGALRIVGEETVLHSGLVVDAPALTALAGFEVRQRLNFTTAPMAPGALDYAAFVRPRVRSVTANNYEFQYSMMPIASNLAGSVDGPMLDPGFYTGFDLNPGDVVDITHANRIMQPAAGDPIAFIESFCFLNMGGALIVEGFEFQPRDDVGLASQRGVVLATLGAIGNSEDGSAHMLSRCHLRHNPLNGVQFNSFVTGDAVTVAGCIATTNYLTIAASDGRGVVLLNFLSNGTMTRLTNTNYGIFGMDGGALEIQNSDGFLYQDARPIAGQSGLSLTNRTRARVEALSVEGCTVPGVDVGPTCSATLVGGGGRIVGSVGNTNVGALLEDQSFVHALAPGSITLSGVGGDVKVGALIAQAWGAGSTTDPTELARLKET